MRANVWFGETMSLFSCKTINNTFIATIFFFKYFSFSEVSIMSSAGDASPCDLLMMPFGTATRPRRRTANHKMYGCRHGHKNAPFVKPFGRMCFESIPLRNLTFSSALALFWMTWQCASRCDTDDVALRHRQVIRQVFSSETEQKERIAQCVTVLRLQANWVLHLQKGFDNKPIFVKSLAVINNNQLARCVVFLVVMVAALLIRPGPGRWLQMTLTNNYLRHC